MAQPRDGLGEIRLRIVPGRWDIEEPSMNRSLCIVGSVVAALGAGRAQLPRGSESSERVPKEVPVSNVALNAPTGGIQLVVDATPSKVGKRAGQGMAIGATLPMVAGVALAMTPLGFIAMAGASVVAIATGAAGAATG